MRNNPKQISGNNFLVKNIKLPNFPKSEESKYMRRVIGKRKIKALRDKLIFFLMKLFKLKMLCKLS